MLGRAGTLQKELQRRTWMKRVRRQRKRLISRALRERKCPEGWRWRQAVSQVFSLCLWAALFVFMLAMSWALFWKTGEASYQELRRAGEEEHSLAGEEGSISVEEEGVGTDLKAWPREILGVEIRIRDGKIIFFQEKKERILEEE